MLKWISETSNYQRFYRVGLNGGYTPAFSTTGRSFTLIIALCLSLISSIHLICYSSNDVYSLLFTDTKPILSSPVIDNFLVFELHLGSLISAHASTMTLYDLFSCNTCFSANVCFLSIPAVTTTSATVIVLPLFLSCCHLS